ncbi:Pycsar system effector family protein [Streptomyces sp. KL118A]|uniref:Pycsar system effector family protein n=1 Tax=Streptomyces sp. KL118A TaxID=3045153 RepID=UPI00278BC054|nr:Pycsar system effector family protein [Streptomyces sp. KL118A]
MSTSENVTAALAEVKAEIARTDNKAALLLAFVGAVFVGGWTVAKDLPRSPTAVVVAGLGTGLLVAAAGLLLGSVRPNLGGSHRRGFPLWATLTAEQLDAELTEYRSTQYIADLSRIALAKFIRLERAVDLTRLGGALLITAVLISLGGAA